MVNGTDARPELSVVVPMYCESGSAAAVLDAIAANAAVCCDTFEIIVVDDGSPDDTWPVLTDERGRRPYLRAIRLSRNFGKGHALSAGLEAACGRGVVVMDGDLQHPPSLIPDMVARWRDGGAQVVEAVKRCRGAETWRSKACAGGFYRLLKLLSGFDLRGATDFKLMDQAVVAAWRRMPERSLFFRGMVAWLGFRRERIEFDVADRVSGGTKWSFFGLARLATGAITAFSSALLQLVTLVGLVFLGFAFLLAVQTLLMKVRGAAVTGFTTVILLLLIVGSLLMISLGLIGLYLARIYDEVKARPRFIVADEIGFGAGADLVADCRSDTRQSPAGSPESARRPGLHHGRREDQEWQTLPVQTFPPSHRVRSLTDQAE